MLELETRAGTTASQDSGALARRLQLEPGVVVGSVMLSADCLKMELSGLLSDQDASFAR
jgi:hypothetical protein